MFTYIRGRVACNYGTAIFKVKVTIWCQSSDYVKIELVGQLTSSSMLGFSNNLAQMFTFMRGRVACNYGTATFKVKVTVWCQSSKYVKIKLVRQLTFSSMTGFSNNLAQMTTLMRRCVACKNGTSTFKVKVTVKLQRSKYITIELVRPVSSLWIIGF